eukprot:403351704
MRKNLSKEYTNEVQSLKRNLEKNNSIKGRSKPKQYKSRFEEQARLDLNGIENNNSSPDHQNVQQEPQSNKFQTALTKLKSLKNTKTFSSNDADPFFIASSQNQSPDRSNTNQESSKQLNTQILVGDFKPPYIDEDDEDDDLSREVKTNQGNFKRRVSKALQRNQNDIEQAQNQSIRLSITDLNIKHRQSLSKSGQQRVAFNDQNDQQSERYATLGHEGTMLSDKIQVHQLTESSPDLVKTKSGRSSQMRDMNLRSSNPQLSLSKMAKSHIVGGLNPFQTEEECVQQSKSASVLKYCQDVCLYFMGDIKLKQIYPIHSQSPAADQVQISLKPNLQRFQTTGDQTSRWQIQNLQDWQCAPALKTQGEIFRILPASDFNVLNKIRKVLKNKEELDPIDHFKYGEHLESLTEEIKFNLDVYEDCKNEIVKFGSSVMFMHENSQMFLKISSPSISDQHSHFKLELSPLMSDKTIFKIIPSNKIQSEGDGRITENDKFFIGFTYDKILNKELFLYTDPILLERQGKQKKIGIKKFEQNYQSLIFSDEKKLPFNFQVNPNNDFERSENSFRQLNGKVIQIKHIESDLYLTLTIKRKENRILNMFFGDKNRYALNKLIEFMPDFYGKEASCNVHFEPRSSINTYWKVYASPNQKDFIQLENAVSKIRLKPMHLKVMSKGGNINFEQIEQDGVYYKIFTQDASLQGSKRNSLFEINNEKKFLWVEYLKFNQQENKYEFSKFGSLNDEDQGSLFDSFKINEVESFKAIAFDFLSHSYKQLAQFDSYQADNDESMEYEKALKVISQLKKFVKNKLNGLIKVEDQCNVPNQEIQAMIKESFIIDVIAELIDQIWPDENYLQADFTGRYNEEISKNSSFKSKSSESSFQSSNISDNGEVHRETKIRLAEKIFELLRLIVDQNLQLQEFVFFEIFGAGFRNNQDFELFNYLVKNCDVYADYKEKTKYSIIFQFIKKLFRDNSSKIEINLLSILRSFCINSKGESNNYHQKLLHDLFFYNKLEGIKFKLQDKKTSRYKSTIQASIQGDNPEAKSVQKIQKDLQLIESQGRYSKSKSMKDIKEGIAIKKLDQNITSSRGNLHPIKEIKIDFSSRNFDEEQEELKTEPGFTLVTDKNKRSKNITPLKSQNKRIYEESEDLKDSPQSSIQDVRYETIDGDGDENFLIRRIHDITLDRLTENIILQSKKDSQLIMIELYFFADLCYLMNFECQCTQFSQKTVANLLKILSNKKSKLDSHVKAGIARILNTILRNHDDNILKRPYLLRMYEMQGFDKPSKQPIISEEDVRTLVKLSRDNFRQLSTEGIESFTEYDSEILRLTQYIIQSNLIFEKDFIEGYNFVTDIFEDIAKLHLKKDVQQVHNNSNMSQQSGSHIKGETTMNYEDFQKQYSKIRKILQQSVENPVPGQHFNPFALKMLNIEKLYTSYVERIVDDNKAKNILKPIKDQNDNQMETARLEIIRFFTWLINLRIDNMLSNVINMFHSQLEGFLAKEDVDLDQLIKNPQKYFIFQYMHRLMTDIISLNNSSDMKTSFLDNIIQGNQGSSQQPDNILDLEEMFQQFLKNKLLQENSTKARSGFSSPIKHQFLTETDEIKEEDKLIKKEDLITPRKGHVQFMHQTEEDMIIEETQINQEIEEAEDKVNQTENTQNTQFTIQNMSNQAYQFICKAINWVQQQNQDILIDIFVNAQSPILQQESIRAIFRFLNARRELLQNLSQTIMIFKSGEKQKIEKVINSLKNIKMITQDSTNWEVPPEQPKTLVVEPQHETVLDDLNHDDQDVIQRSNTKGASSIQYSKKVEYAQKLKEHQKNQQQLIQSLAFTKSNKSTEAKNKAIDQLIDWLDELNGFFTLNHHQSPSTYRSDSTQKQDGKMIEMSSAEKYLRLLPSQDLDTQLPYIQQDLQYAFLAVKGHQTLIAFMKNCKEIRQECLRIIFYGTKPKEGIIFDQENMKNPRIQYAIKVLISFKKCYEILIKFTHNNKTTKQVMLSDIDEVLLFNSEYYMVSKMAYQISLFDFELLNCMLDDNAKIKQVSSTMCSKLNYLISYIHKIIEFPKKPLKLAPQILKVYSNIIANCDNAKINDQIVDLILKEEVFFQIQNILLGINMRKSKLSSSEQLDLIEKFLKGISQILQGQNVRMIKKKFYQIFQKSHDHETYFNHLKELFNQACNQLKLQQNQKPEIQSGAPSQFLIRNQSSSYLTKIEDEIKNQAEKFLNIEAYFITIFNKLFFDVKGTQKEIQDKGNFFKRFKIFQCIVDEMRMFIEARERDITILKNQQLTDYQNFGSYSIFKAAINECLQFCSKNSSKLNIMGTLSSSLRKSFEKNQLLLSQHAQLSRRNSNIKGQTPRGLQSTQIKNSMTEETEKTNELQVSEDSNIQNTLKPMFKKQLTNIFNNLKQNQSAQKKEQIFKIFKWNTLHDENIRNELKKEMHTFSEILLRKFKQADENGSDLDQQKYHLFFTKLIQYSNMFQEDKNMLNDTKILVDIFSQFIDLTNEGQSYKGEGFEAKTIIQEKLHSIGAVEMVLDMMCSENNEQIDEIFPQLLYFSNRILDGAQNNIQDFFTDYLTKNEKSINLFERCYNLIEKEIQHLRKHNKNQQDEINNNVKKIKEKVPKAYDKQINVQKHILKFFKNLCENHNTKMQLLIGNQQNADKNFDMVSLTVNYLHALISNINLSKRNYSNAQNCCISLAEYVQGPCFVNQSRIKEANFYQLAIQILSIKPHLTDESNQKDGTSNQTQQNNIAQQRRKSMRVARAVSNKNFDLSFKDLQDTEDQNQDSDFKLSNFMIQKLKLNCTIILLSLLEQRPSDDPLLLSMKRSIPLELIKQNIMYEYFLFCKDYNKFLSKENFFRHVLTQSDYEVKEELIIEVGFNLYFLLKRWAENKKTNDGQLDDLLNSMDQEATEGYSIFGSIQNIYNSMLKIKKDAIKKYAKFMEGSKLGEKSHNRQKLQAFLQNDSNLKQALMFFRKNSATIDVLVKNSIEQVHFPYMPYCTYLSEEEKVEFYNALPTDRDKEKIEVLVLTSTDLIRRMKIEYEFKKFFIEYPLIGELVYHTEQWKQIAFYIILTLNIMNLYSFSAINEHDRLYSPAFYGYSTEFTEFLYLVFGTIQIILSILINFTVISKRAIYHYHLVFSNKQSQNNEDESMDSDLQSGFWQRPKKLILKDITDYSWSAVQDFQLLYYMGYLFFSFVGLFFHPFFYAYHMIDMIIRNPYLKNVLKAVYRPRYELFNTLILFLCLQYIFAMISYVFFFEDFEKGECSSLSQCFLVIIDQTFKNDGGIGTFLNRAYPDEMNKGGQISMIRFIFDNTFNVILVILVVEIISGIIIDTFGALREEHNKITDSIENKCMICGKNRDQIEKEFQDMIANEENQSSSNNKENEEKAFDIHKKYSHNIYDYIFFLAYLKEKPELEYTGLESFVFEKYSEQNNTWFPIYKVGGDKQKQLQSSSHDDDSEGDEDDENSDQVQDEDDDNQNTLHQEKESKNSNKMVMEYLKQMNSKIELITESIGLGFENDAEDNFTGFGIRNQGTIPSGAKKESSINRATFQNQQTNKFKNQGSTSTQNTLGVTQSPKLQANTLNINNNNSRVSSNFINRQNSGRFQKAKTKLNAF